MIRKIPPNIFWPAFIFGLLGIAITASFTILFFAKSDGGPQVVPDYYQRSVEYDDHYRARQASIELGWQANIDLNGERGELHLSNGDGEPIEGVEGTLTFYRPSLAEPVATTDIAEATDEPGLYTFDHPAREAGYWDVALELERGDDAFIDTIRKERPRS